MITLYTFGPGAGLPDFSPSVVKAEVLLKMSGLAYRTDTTGFRKAPKGKLPYIDDDTLCPQFRSPVRDAAERYDNLRRYVGRMTARYYPDYQEMAGCPAAA
jgi:hypothetical protein